jgi:hypothetical protein
VAALDLVGAVVDALDAAALDEHAGLDEAARVRQEAAAAVVHLEPLAGEALLAADEDDVALRDQPVALLAVRVRHLVDVGLVGLDAHAGEVQVHEPARLDVPLLDLLVGLGAHVKLAGVRGRRRGHGSALRLLVLRSCRLRALRGLLGRGLLGRRLLRRGRRYGSGLGWRLRRGWLARWLLRLGTREAGVERQRGQDHEREPLAHARSLETPRGRPCPSRGSRHPRG